MKRRETQSRNTNTDKIAFLSKEINQLSGELHSDTVVHLIYTVDVLNEYIRRTLIKSKATYAKIRILSTLILNGGSMRMTDLSVTTFRAKCSLTRTINNMVRDGLVTKSVATNDKRGKIVTISIKGLDLVEAIIPQRQLTSIEIMSVLNRNQMLELTKTLSLIRKNVRKNLLSKMNK